MVRAARGGAVARTGTAVELGKLPKLLPVRTAVSKCVYNCRSNSLKPEWSALRTEFIVTVADTLTMEFIATNGSVDKTLVIEACLHSYFHVGDISAVSITGLQGTDYLDNTDGEKHGRIKDNAPVLRIPIKKPGPHLPGHDEDHRDS